MLRHPCILGGTQRQARGTKSELAASPQKRAEMLCHPCILRDAQRQARGENQNWLPHPYLLGGAQMGGKATSPLHSQGSRTKGTKLELVASALPSRKRTNGRKCYVTPAFSGVPNAKRGEQNQEWLPNPAFSGAQTRVEMLHHPCILGGPQCQARGGNQNCLLHLCLLGGQQMGGIAMQPLHSRRSPKKGIKSKVATSPLPSRGPTSGQNSYVTPAFSGVPNAKRGEQKENWPPHPCLLGGPHVGGIAT